jgi:hypothetical protein
MTCTCVVASTAFTFDKGGNAGAPPPQSPGTYCQRTDRPVHSAQPREFNSQGRLTHVCHVMVTRPLGLPLGEEPGLGAQCIGVEPYFPSATTFRLEPRVETPWPRTLTSEPGLVWAGWRTCPLSLPLRARGESPRLIEGKEPPLAVPERQSLAHTSDAGHSSDVCRQSVQP